MWPTTLIPFTPWQGRISRYEVVEDLTDPHQLLRTIIARIEFIWGKATVWEMHEPAGGDAWPFNFISTHRLDGTCLLIYVQGLYDNGASGLICGMPDNNRHASRYLVLPPLHTDILQEFVANGTLQPWADAGPEERRGLWHSIVECIRINLVMLSNEERPRFPYGYL